MQHDPSSAGTPQPSISRTTRAVAVGFALVSVIGIGGGIVGRFVKETTATRARAEGLAERREAASLPPEVTVESPAAYEYNPFFSITGILDPVQEAELGFTVAGRLASIEVTLGQRVEAGDVLAVLDRRSISAQSAVVGAAVEAVNAQVAMARDRLQRAQALHARGATTDADLEAARQQLALAEAQLAQATAQTRVVSSDGSNHILRAPYAGTVTRVPNGVGNVVMPGAALFRVEDLSALVLRTGITERALNRIMVGDSVSLELFPNVRGAVRAFARSLDTVGRRAPVEIDFPNPEGVLVGHQLVKGQVHSTRAIPTMRISGTAVRADSTVLVVGADSKLEARRVEAIVEADGAGIVLFGLTPGDRVVVRPTPDLAPGRVVRIAGAPRGAR